MSKCIDIYIEKRRLIYDKKDLDAKIDPRMELIVNAKFEQCFQENHFKQVFGIAFQTRRIDIV